MSPILSLLVGLTTLIPQAFSISIPANPAVGLTNSISVDIPGDDNPLPPSPPGWYHIPGTSLSINLLLPYGAVMPSQTDALHCLLAAQTSIANTIAARGDDGRIPHPRWQFAAYNVHLAASSPFRNLGTYGQLSSGLTGLLHLMMTAAGGPGARRLRWVLSDDVQGIVMNGAIGPDVDAGVGAVQAGATAVSSMGNGTVASTAATATATATQSVGIVGYEELFST